MRRVSRAGNPSTGWGEFGESATGARAGSYARTVTPLPTIPGLSGLRPLGRGRFATVYHASQYQLDRDVAVKVGNQALTAEVDRARFVREAQAASRLSGQPHVVSVHDAGITDDGRPYLVMELCSDSLARFVERQGPLRPERVREIGVHLAEALAAAHTDGVLHRDIKASNVLVDSFGAVKLADFGLAAIMDAQRGPSTTAEPTAADDVHALAACLWGALAGRLPRSDAPLTPVPGVPMELHQALARALDPNAARRTPSAAQLRDDLSEVRFTSAPVAQPAPAPPPAPSRGPVPWLAAAAGAAVVVAGIVVWAVLGNAEDVEPVAAPQTSTADTPEAAQPSTSPTVGQKFPPGLIDCGDADQHGPCVAEPFCYDAVSTPSGKPRPPQQVPCEGQHRWEVFGGDWLPQGTAGKRAAEVQRMPMVQRACTDDALRARTRPGADTSDFHAVVVVFGLPDGREFFHCVGSTEPSSVSVGSVFTSIN